MAFVPMLVYALLGTSRPLSVSSTTTIATPDFEYTALRALVGAEEKLRERGIALLTT